MRINTIIDNKELILYVESPNRISGRKHTLGFSNNIKDIIITSNYIIIIESQKTWNFTFERETRSEDNVSFYDWDGKFQFNIASIIKDTGFSYTGGGIPDKETFEARKFSPLSDHEYFMLYRENDRVYILDLTDKKVMYGQCERF